MSCEDIAVSKNFARWLIQRNNSQTIWAVSNVRRATSGAISRAKIWATDVSIDFSQDEKCSRVPNHVAWDGVASVARHRELVVNRAFKLGDDHVVIIFLEVSDIKSASLDGKSPVGV